MPEAQPRTRPHPDEANKRNEADASKANRRTIANVQKNESDKEKAELEIRSPT